MRSGELGVSRMRRSAWLYGQSRLGAECNSVQEALELLLRELSWRRPDPMSMHVRLIDAIMPAPRAEYDVYFRFRSAYRRVAGAHNAPVDSVREMCMTCDEPDAPPSHMDTCIHSCCMGIRREGVDVNRIRREGVDINRIRREGVDSSSSQIRREGVDTDNFPPISAAQSSLYQMAVRKHMQRKLLGYVLEKIYKANDFMATFCYEDSRSYLTNCVKETVVKLNTALEPWYLLLGKITGHKRLQQINAWKQPGHEEKKFCVYARLHLTSQTDLYIGETQNLGERIKQHYFATCKHRHDAPNPCKRCNDHSKYRKHRTAMPHEWMMIPVTYASSKKEARKMERLLIKNLKPNINASDKPFWLLKDTYAQQYKNAIRKRKNPSAAPWRLNKEGTREDTVEQVDMPMFTTYVHQGNTYMNFAAVLNTIVIEDPIIITPGKHDITNWKRVRIAYGDSLIYETEKAVPMRIWKAKPYPSTVKICINKTPLDDHKAIKETFKNLQNFREQLEKASDEDLAFYWRCRHSLDKTAKHKARKLIWEECCERYNCTASPIEIRIPFFEQLNPQEVTGWVRVQIRKTAWPSFIQEWHIKRLRIITESQPTISEILCNVTSPFNNCKGECCCAEIYQRLHKRGLKKLLPMVNGHIFGISRDYDGPNKEALKVSANNIPQQTRWDLQRAWEKIYKQLPLWMQPAKGDWNNLLTVVTKPFTFKRPLFTNTKAVYTLRKDLQGLIIGPIDKNLNELWFCCPTLYREAWEKTYTQNPDYKEIFPKVSKATKGIPEEAYQHEAPVKSGEYTDIIRLWERAYKENGWDKLAPFNKRGGFNRPYIIFKSKNITDLAVRQEKWYKARPIAPQTKHPMKRLFHLTGRAWSFITANIPGEHFVLNHGGQIPKFFSQVETKLRPYGPMKVRVKDIEGCFPNMDKDDIRNGLQHITNLIATTYGHKAVYIPTRGKAPCQWKARKGFVEIPFLTLLDVMKFALENTIITDLEGNLYKQLKGIPMGDPHSPGMTIGACAWMEQTWLQTLSSETRSKIIARRYMDDVIIFSAQDTDTDTLLKSCYHKPLNLEDARHDTFLETSFSLKDSTKIQHWLKNDNVPHEPKKVWRYAHFHSYMAFNQKKAVLKACLKKVHYMASDNNVLEYSAYQKLQEFSNLKYPSKLLWTMCTTMGVQTRNPTWFEVRDAMY